MKLHLDSVGEIVAERKLTLLHDGKPFSEVLVFLGKPKQTPGLPDFYCPYQFKGAGSEKVSYICGIDPFQALMLAIKSLACDLDVLNKHLGENLRREGDDKGWLGFPE
jgi:hypothetical protein